MRILWVLPICSAAWKPKGIRNRNVAGYPAFSRYRGGLALNMAA